MAGGIGRGVRGGGGVLGTIFAEELTAAGGLAPTHPGWNRNGGRAVSFRGLL